MTWDISVLNLLVLESERIQLVSLIKH